MAYGEKYQKTYTSIQVRVVGIAALTLEQELRDMGIEAHNGSPQRVNIRVDEDFVVPEVKVEQ